jgi:hypothetical protein
MASAYDLFGGAVNQPLQLTGPGGTPYSIQPTDPWAQLLQGLAPIVGGIGSLATSNLGMNTARQAAGMADPFSGERPVYQADLRNYMGANAVNPTAVTAGTNSALANLMGLLSNPASISSLPEYQAGLGFGTQAVNRGQGAAGFNFSPNRAVALDKFGQDYGMGFLNQMVSNLSTGVNENIAAANLGLGAQQQGYGQLATLAGALTGNPAVAGGLVNQGRTNQISDLGQASGGFLTGGSTALQAMQRILGGPSGYTGNMNATQLYGPPSDMFGGSDFFGPPSDLFGGDAGSFMSDLGNLPY